MNERSAPPRQITRDDEILDWAHVIVEIGWKRACEPAKRYPRKHHENIRAAKELLLELLKAEKGRRT